MIEASFVVPVKNGEDFIGKTISSLTRQTVKNIEIIIVNDHSDDETVKIVKSLSAKDQRILFFNLPSNIYGVSNARNFGTQKARGKIILPTDADDPNELNRAEISLSELNSTRSDIFYATLNHYYTETGKTERRFFQPYDPELLQYVNYINHAGASAYKKDLFTKLGGYDTNIEIGEDYDLWLRAQETGARFCSKNTVLSRYTIHTQQTTATTIEKRHFWLKKIRAKHHIYEINLEYVKKHAEKDVIDFFVKNPYYFKIWFDKNSIPTR